MTQESGAPSRDQSPSGQVGGSDQLYLVPWCGLLAAYVVGLAALPDLISSLLGFTRDLQGRGQSDGHYDNVGQRGRERFGRVSQQRDHRVHQRDG
jgi:hypothetical protein